jgi:hypothetical protein
MARPDRVAGASAVGKRSDHLVWKKGLSDRRRREVTFAEV